ncbi:tripartite tricarboxylate transporter substrate binding protein [Alcaligenaceae bacterium]|nr:tripartite tricarboxylate transporter substrate binding protein [Alcaligenaceae bacterium]
MKNLKWVAAMLMTCCAVAAAQAASYPERAVRLIVPFPPAGAPDALARMLSAFVEEKHGWGLVVENKPGAGGNLALDQAARSRPDGYTLVMGQTDNVVLNPLIYSKLTYDPDKDLEPVGLVAKGALVMVVKADSPYQTVDDVIKAAKANPEKVTFASPGYGTSIHIVHQLWQQASDINITHVPYKGSAFALPDLLGGRVDLYMGSVPTLQGQIESGAVRPLAVTSDARVASLKDVPTFREQGVEGVEMASAFGLLVPRGTPADIISKWNTAINDMLQSPEARGKITQMGADSLGGTPQQMRDLYANDRQRLGDVIRAAGIKLD